VKNAIPIKQEIANRIVIFILLLPSAAGNEQKNQRKLDAGSGAGRLNSQLVLSIALTRLAILSRAKRIAQMGSLSVN
jgi:hypothetical protein